MYLLLWCSGYARDLAELATAACRVRLEQTSSSSFRLSVQLQPDLVSPKVHMFPPWGMFGPRSSLATGRMLFAWGWHVSAVVNGLRFLAVYFANCESSGAMPLCIERTCTLQIERRCTSPPKVKQKGRCWRVRIYDMHTRSPAASYVLHFTFKHGRGFHDLLGERRVITASSLFFFRMGALFLAWRTLVCCVLVRHSGCRFITKKENILCCRLRVCCMRRMWFFARNATHT